MEVIVCEGYERHSTLVVGMGYVADGLEEAKMFLSGGRGGSPTSEAVIDGVNRSA